MANVLIVDDSSTMRKLVTRALRQAEFVLDEIIEAGDGIEALAALNGNKIDLILSDINMPNMDGIEFVKSARSMGCKVPIVMITTEGGADVVHNVIACGANDCIRKPFTSEQLKVKLGDFL
jgi:two-component system chemotaxis response regulator CheY